MLNIKASTKGGSLLMGVMIDSVRRIGTSTMGNPRYRLYTDNGPFDLMSDASVTYGLDDHVGKHLVCLELSRAGRVRYITPMSALERFYGPSGQ